jgi:HSP20 family protein
LPRAACIAVATLSREGVEIISTLNPEISHALPLEELRDEMDRLWTSLTTAPPLHGWGVEERTGLFPAVNMRERDDAIVIEAELPGLDEGDLDIAVTADEVILKGTRPEAGPSTGEGEPTEKVTWLRRERGTGAFERRLSLPTAVDAARVEARLVDGVLTVTCPKAPESQPHKVSVRTA